MASNRKMSKRGKVIMLFVFVMMSLSSLACGGGGDGSEGLCSGNAQCGESLPQGIETARGLGLLP